MLVRSIHLEGFMAYKEAASVELPERGIVTISGGNGEGKSALAEAVCSALWGKTMRGSPFWRKGERCKVQVLADEVYVTRKVTAGGSKTLEWLREEGEHATASKAQNDLDRYIPDMETWKRCSVFSSADSDLFTGATDKAKKELLESLLGLTRFDDALVRCRGDLVGERKTHAKLDANLSRAEAILAEKRSRLEEARAGVEKVGRKKHPGALKKREEALSERYQRGYDYVREQEDQLAKARYGGGADADELVRLEDQRAQLADGTCPTCGQAVGENILGPIEKSIKNAKANARKRERRRAKKVEELSERVMEANKLLGEVTRDLAEVRTQVRAMDESDRARKHLQEVLQSAESEIALVADQVAKVAGELEVQTKAVRTMEAVEGVLGLRGVRAHVLGRALEGLEAIAAGHVRRMLGPAVELRLLPYRNLKKGGREDSISMDLLGVGGGHGYGANSGGQRRCVDVSLLLGLAQVSDASRGAKPGTVWFDEVFDALDRERVGVVSEIMREMSEHRPVVVISHNPALLGDLAPHRELGIHVADHKISAA